MKEKRPGKIDLDAPSSPLQAGLSAFGALDALQALGSLPPGTAPEPPPVPPGPEKAAKTKRGRLLLRREKKDRGGKTVVVISGAAPAEADELARALRKALGCGSSVADGEIVVQGDQPAAVAAFLRDLGFAVGGVTA